MSDGGWKSIEERKREGWLAFMFPYEKKESYTPKNDMMLLCSNDPTLAADDLRNVLRGWDGDALGHVLAAAGLEVLQGSAGAAAG